MLTTDEEVAENDIEEDATILEEETINTMAENIELIPQEINMETTTEEQITIYQYDDRGLIKQVRSLRT